MCFGMKQPDPPKPVAETMTYETETAGVTSPSSSSAHKPPAEHKPMKESTEGYRGGRTGPSGLGNM